MKGTISGTIYTPHGEHQVRLVLELEDTPATAWNPAAVPAYDVPPQTVAEILEEYERDWAAERAADECNEGAYCPICDTDE